MNCPFDLSFYLTAKCQIANLDILKVCTIVQSKGLKSLIDTTTVFTTVVALAHVGAFAG